jgi:hypothetical protein
MKAIARFVNQILEILEEPRDFFEKTKQETWKEALVFFLKITIFISIITTILNFLGIESNKFSSSYQAQILGYKATQIYFVNTYGNLAYLIEPFLIVLFSFPILFLSVIFLHVVMKMMNGEGTILNAWKAICYGVAPCILCGFLPYVSLFVGFWSLLLQFYIAPIVLYKIKEWKANIFISILIALIFIETFYT